MQCGVVEAFDNLGRELLGDPHNPRPARRVFLGDQRCGKHCTGAAQRPSADRTDDHHQQSKSSVKNSFGSVFIEA
jgi:hypothetical protein